MITIWNLDFRILLSECLYLHNQEKVCSHTWVFISLNVLFENGFTFFLHHLSSQFLKNILSTTRFSCLLASKLVFSFLRMMNRFIICQVSITHVNTSSCFKEFVQHGDDLRKTLCNEYFPYKCYNSTAKYTSTQTCCPIPRMPNSSFLSIAAQLIICMVFESTLLNAKTKIIL